MIQCQLKVSEKFRRVAIKQIYNESTHIMYAYFHSWQTSFSIRAASRGFQAHAIVEMENGDIRLYDTFEYSFKFIDPIQ